MVHDALSRHFGLFWRFGLVHHRLRRVWGLHRPLRHHRLHVLLLAVLRIVLGIVLVAALLAVAVLLLRLRLVADLGGRVDDGVGSRLVLKVVLVVRTDGVDAQRVPRLASLLAVRALVDESGDMCLDMLLHS